MPEGDTIFRTARTLRSVLVGQPVQHFEAANIRPPDIAVTITSVEARGKHLLIWLSDDSAIHTHMGMHGSWHVYRDEAAWQRPGHEVRVRIDVPGWTAVCFAPSVAERLRRSEVLHHRRLAALGPDLCDPNVDFDEALRRLDSRADMQIGAAIMDQTVACGVGNVYKSETLFALGIDPFATVRGLNVDQRLDILRTASRLLQLNLNSSQRVTSANGRQAVYDRSGRDCPRCAGSIRMRHQGQPPRSTYWCPDCQIKPSQRS